LLRFPLWLRDESWVLISNYVRDLFPVAVFLLFMKEVVMSTRMRKLFFLVIPLMSVFLLTPAAFAKKRKHCNPRYDQSYYDRSYDDRRYYDPYYRRGRYDDRYYGRYGDNSYRRRTYGGSRYNDGYYGGSYYPPGGSTPWWDILIPRY
jgi:hypothetical protein